MSEHSFIYPNHPNFQPFLELAESTELIVADRGHLHYERVDAPYELTTDYARFGHIDTHEPVSTQTETARTGQQAITDDFWDHNAGLDTLSFYKTWPEGYVNDGYRISGNYHYGNRPMANEIIAYGVGVLRPRKPEHKGLGSFFAETARRVDSRYRETIATYIVDMHHHDGVEWTSKPRALESTNLVMPETLGELRQLAERRNERDFISAYLSDLLATLRPTPIPVYTRGPVEIDPDRGDKSPLPKCIASKKWRWREAHRAHIQSGLWVEPPVDNAELIDRVDTLLSQIAVDDSPVERIQQDKPSPELLQLIDKYLKS